MTQKKIESKALFVSTAVNFIIVLSGVWVYARTGIQALFLDCAFSFIGFLSSVFAAMISKISFKKTKHYPQGLHFLEPLYAALKSVLILALLVVSLVQSSQSAYLYFTKGIKKAMDIEPILPYTIAMVVLCFGIGVYNRMQNRKINDTSTILKAESKANIIDGLQSLGIGIAFGLLHFIDKNGAFGFLWYTQDFFITLLLVVISVKQPIKVLWDSMTEITKGDARDQDIVDFIHAIVNEAFAAILIKSCYKCSVVKSGMYIEVTISLSQAITKEYYDKLLQARRIMYKAVHKRYENVVISYIF